MFEAMLFVTGIVIGLIGGAMVGAKHRDRVYEIEKAAEEEARVLAESAKKRLRRAKSKDSGAPK